MQEDWKPEDDDFEEQLDSQVKSWRGQRQSVDVPRQLDRKITRIARQVLEEPLESNWVFSQPVRLVLVILVFFAIGVAYVLSLP